MFHPLHTCNLMVACAWVRRGWLNSFGTRTWMMEAPSQSWYASFQSTTMKLHPSLFLYSLLYGLELLITTGFWFLHYPAWYMVIPNTFFSFRNIIQSILPIFSGKIRWNTLVIIIQTITSSKFDDQFRGKLAISCKSAKWETTIICLL